MSTTCVEPLLVDDELERRFSARLTSSPHEALVLRYENLPGNFAGKYVEQRRSTKDV